MTKFSRLKSIIAVLLCVCFSLTTFVGCDNGSYTVNKAYQFGMCELTAETMPTSAESGLTADWISKKCNQLGVKAVRVWMHHNNILYRANKSDDIFVNQSMAEEYHKYFQKLKTAGVERILVMNHHYLHPYGYVGDSTSVPNPEEEFDLYVRFLKMYENAYRLLQEEFPEICYWECGNENDHPQGLFMHKSGYKISTTGSPDGEYLYTESQLAFITADLCWYAKQGVTSVNKDAKIVLPGMTITASAPIFFENIYKHIEARYLPSGKDYADVNVDNYFDIIAWHPYWNSLSQSYDSWNSINESFRKIATNHGDKYKTVWFTEMGFTNNVIKDEQITADRMELLMTKVRDEMPWVETVFVFRLSNCREKSVSDFENNFGVFNSPNDEEIPGEPKKIAYTLYKFFNGREADESTFQD